MSSPNWKKLRLLLVLALASAPLIEAQTATKLHKPIAATSKTKDTYQDKSQPTGLNHNETEMQNFKQIPGKSRLVFYNPETHTTRAIGIDGTTQYRLNKGRWQEQEFPVEMSGYFAVSTSGKALSSSQIDALLKAGDLAGLADHAIAAQIAAKASGVTAATTLTEAELAVLETLRKAAIAQGNTYIAGLTADVDGKLVKNEGITPHNLKGKDWKEVSAKTGLYELPGGIKKIEINGLGHTWGINTSNEVVFKASLAGKDDWENTGDIRKEVVLNNKGHIWSIDNEHRLYVRGGVTPTDLCGTEWIPFNQHTWSQSTAINDNNLSYHAGVSDVWYRAGITDSNPMGTSFHQLDVPLPDVMKQLSLNNKNQLWAVGERTGMAYVLAGLSQENPSGNGKWIPIPGKCKQIVAVSGGAWCIDDQDKVFFREGVTEAKPEGTGWAGPFPHDLNYIFASGSSLAEPKLAPIHAAIKTKQTNHRLIKMQHILETEKEKEATAQGADKEKLAQKIKKLENRIKKLSKHQDVKKEHKNMRATEGKKDAARAASTATKRKRSKKIKKTRGEKTGKAAHKKKYIKKAPAA